MISTRPALERCFGPLMANSRAQLRIILIRTIKGNWRKSSSIRPGGNGVVVVVVEVVVVVGVGGGVGAGKVFIRGGCCIDRETSS